MPPRMKRKKDCDSLSTYEQSPDDFDRFEPSTRRKVNVFEAVAGRVTIGGFVKDSRYGQQEAILAPEEALFKSDSAPERFQEDDFYWADRNLPPDCLPETDLLEAIHVFASDYYHSTRLSHEQIDFKSLDGSALLALGVLLEESARDILGETGDLAFVEGQPIETTAETSDNRMDIEESESAASVKVTKSMSRDSSTRSTKRQRRL